MKTVTTANASRFVVVDSGGWIKFFGNQPLAEKYAPYFDREDLLIVPTIVIYEVFKKIKNALGEGTAHQFLSQALRTRVVPLDEHLAVAATEVSTQYKLPMADAMIYATALAERAELITSDAHFRGLPGVTLVV